MRFQGLSILDKHILGGIAELNCGYLNLRLIFKSHLFSCPFKFRPKH